MTDGLTSTAVCITIVVPPPPAPTDPVAVADTYACPAYRACTVGAAGGLSANDTTPNAGPIRVTGSSSPSAGTVVVDPSGSFQWTPPYP